MKEEASHLIVIVDDDQSVREATANLLKSNSFKAESCSSAEDFLGSPLIATARCLLLDVKMPGMSGLELQRHLATEGHRIPIIFITAHDKQEVRNEAMRAGAIDFLPKPFSEEALLLAIRNALKIPLNGKGMLR
jgi:FixJ family two-component response regulator